MILINVNFEKIKFRERLDDDDDGIVLVLYYNNYYANSQLQAPLPGTRAVPGVSPTFCAPGHSGIITIAFGNLPRLVPAVPGFLVAGLAIDWSEALFIDVGLHIQSK